MGIRDTSDFLSGLLIMLGIIFAEESEKREDDEVWRAGPEAKYLH